jgi:hypothetical protein
MGEPLTHYVITRRDLSRGVQAANLIHAAGESSPGNLASNTYAVALACPDEPALEALRAVLTANGVHYRAIVETEGPHAGQLMALGLVPCDRASVRKALSQLPLLR